MFNLRNSFPGQETDEAVFIFARPNLIAFLPTSFIFLLVFLGELALQVAVNQGSIQITNIGQTVLVLALGAAELFTIIVYTVALFDFYFDILIVTDRKVVDINQDQLFHRQISELNLADIEDATSITKGIFQTFFDFGTVMVQTAGTQANFVALNFSHPRQIAAIISDLAAQAKAGTKDRDRKPGGATIGVIDGHKVASPAELIKIGAVQKDDKRYASKVQW